jgi:hypothetical protein
MFPHGKKILTLLFSPYSWQGLTFPPKSKQRELDHLLVLHHYSPDLSFFCQLCPFWQPDRELFADSVNMGRAIVQKKQAMKGVLSALKERGAHVHRLA